jgi:hypothetical protein
MSDAWLEMKRGAGDANRYEAWRNAIVGDAARAVEIFGDDELERFARDEYEPDPPEPDVVTIIPNYPPPRGPIEGLDA